MEEGTSQDSIPEIQLRIPGPWESPRDFRDRFEAVADGKYSLEDDASILDPASGTRYRLGTSDHDDDIATFFAETGRMSDDAVDELATHVVKVHLIGPGGSVDSARAIMDVAQVILEAGGYGVFVDNSGIAHPPHDWQKLTESSDNGGVFWAFVATTAGRMPDEDDEDDDEPLIFSTGMHCLGYRDAEMVCPEDRQFGEFILNNFLGYCYQSGRTVIDGDILMDLQLPTFRAIHRPCTRYQPGTGFHNPYGMWFLEPVEGEDETENN